MSYVDEWAQSIAKQLKSEAERIGSQARSDLYEDGARDAFVRIVLEPFLPNSYGVASGRVVDAAGNISQPQDIVIYRRDYPQFNMPDSQNVFVFESVVATVQVCSKLIRKTFFNALDRCASLGELEPAIDSSVMKALAAKTGMKLNHKKQYVHPDPLNSGRFGLIGRPLSFIYAFTGYQTSEHQLEESLVHWMDEQEQDRDALQLKSLPSVIATQGCFGWRNTAPFSIKKPVLMGIGKDKAPVRLIILHLLHAFNRRLHSTSDGYGIKSSIEPYLAQFEWPVMTRTVGTAMHAGQTRPKPAAATDAVEKAPLVETPKVANTEKPAAEVKPVAAEEVKPAAAVKPVVAETAKPAPAVKPVAAEAAKPTVAEIQPAAPRPVQQAADSAKPESTAVTEAPTPVTSKTAQAAEVKQKPAPEPVIENLSAPPRLSEVKSRSPVEKATSGKGAANPLSLFAQGEESGGEEEYRFEPIVAPDHQHLEQGDEGDSGDEFMKTLEVKTSEFADAVKDAAQNAAQNAGAQFSNTVVMARPPQVGEEESSAEKDDEAAAAKTEDQAADESEQSRSHHNYVTEQLI